jgi:hypothetical protein
VFVTAKGPVICVVLSERDAKALTHAHDEPGSNHELSTSVVRSDDSLVDGLTAVIRVEADDEHCLRLQDLFARAICGPPQDGARQAGLVTWICRAGSGEEV